MSVNIKALKHQRASAKACITRISKWLEKNSNNPNIDEFQIRIQLLSENFSQYNQVQDQIEILLEESEQAVSDNEERDVLEEKYCTTVSKINACIRNLTSSQTKVLKKEISNPPDIKLPEIQIPTFDGRISNWSSFYELFDSVVLSNPNIPDIKKLVYLKSSLTGEPLHLLEGIELRDSNLEVALETLKKRYENKNYILNTFLVELFDFPEVNKTCPKSLRDLTAKTYRIIKSIQNLRVPENKLLDYIYVFLINKKVDTSTKRLFEQQRKADQFPTLEEYYEFLQNRCTVLENIQASSHSNNYSENKNFKKFSKVSTHVTVDQNLNKCFYCKHIGHRIYYCDSFKNLSIFDRNKFVNSINLCKNCLGGIHPKENCHSDRVCASCNRDHHSLLHYEKQTHNQNYINRSNQNISNRNNSSNFPANRSQNFNSPQRVGQRNNDSNSNNENSQNSSPSQNCYSQPSTSNSQKAEIPRQNTTNSQVVSTLSTKDNHILLTTAQVTLYTKQGRAVSAKILLDTGSQMSFATQDLVNKLQCDTIEKSFQVSGINQQTTVSNKMVNLTIYSNVNSNDYFKVSCAVLPRITGRLPQVKIDPNKINIPSNIPLADPEYFNPSEIHILIGCNIYYSLVTAGCLQLGNSRLYLQNTRLGWLVAGDIPSRCILTNISTVNEHSTEIPLCSHAAISNSDLNDSLTKFWTVEEIPSKQVASPEDELAEQTFLSSTIILQNGRFQTNIPLKSSSEHLKLGDSFSSAKRRFLSLEKRFEKNLELFNEYKNFINTYIQMDHARYVPLKLQNSLHENKYFIPHLCVIRENSVSTRLRVVFDASCPTTSGLSLNDITLKGYQIQPELFDILCRFRLTKFAIVSDVIKMYRQIKTNPEQNFLQNILWRESPDLPLRCIELTTVTYGCNFSPFIATRVLKEIANKYQNKFPLASNAISNQTYMDDILSGANSEQELFSLYTELNTILKAHGFHLHKWSSNSSKVIEKILQSDPVNDLTSKNPVDLNLNSEPSKVLGLHWNPKSDKLCVSVPTSYPTIPVTKRKILSTIASCYDPTGLVNPVVLKGKILMQLLWTSKIGWDTDISETAILSEWQSFITNLPVLSNLQIPRYVMLDKPILKIEIHTFADASSHAFATCLYVRTIYVDNTVSCTLISAKSRVAPISKQLTIPKLELSAMLLAAQLTHKILQVFSNQLKIDSTNLWSDSKVALCWNNSSSTRWPTFVANRVSKIQELSSTHTWRYVKSEENPADLASRGCQAKDLIKNEMWWYGPSFLKDPNLQLSQLDNNFNPSDVSEQEEISLILTNNTKTNDSWVDILFSTFSSFSKLQRTIAYVMRFFHNCRNAEKLSGTLSPAELNTAESTIVKIIQQTHFQLEISELKSNKIVHNKQINSLKPFIDDFGLLRVGGRLENAQISYGQKHPILLPAKHFTVNLMIKLEHVRLGHAGAQTTLSNFRLRFWPLNGLRQTKKIIRNCHQCFRFSSQPCSQIMADLPKDRVMKARPFQKVGIDFGGPFQIRTSRLRKAPTTKCYVAIFICLVTKCIHIEIVSSLSTDAFLMTLKRFISRRGNPSVIFSDNATNFVGANNRLQELHHFFKNSNNSHSIKDFLSQTRIEWKFIPPRSPHWGGIWESAIKSAKFHMIRIIGNVSLTFEEISTVLAQIEAILNSRPISAMSNDPSDLECLTPGHFLIGSSLTSFPESDLTKIPENRLSFWLHCSKMQQHFWQRWSTDYLNRLQNRPKWLNPSENIKINDMVLLKEDSTVPLQWPLARVIEVLPGRDGKVRLVKLRTANGTYSRSIAKICPLPMPNDGM
jgi:Pao retrotransposon peptidase/Family of unknown function (DUF5641)/Protein of unknown function (DUF1759)/Putative peptidase (DUF1758)/Integrase core domain/Integrase zinc binding domain/Reverse transcriptase (RNA-dependent DNA polymerase)